MQLGIHTHQILIQNDSSFIIYFIFMHFYSRKTKRMAWHRNLAKAMAN